MGPYHALGAVKEVCTTGGRLWLVYYVQGVGMRYPLQGGLCVALQLLLAALSLHDGDSRGSVLSTLKDEPLPICYSNNIYSTA